EALQTQLEAGQQSLAEQQARWPEPQSALKEAIAHEQAARRALTEQRARHEALAQLQARVQSSGKLGDWLERYGLASLAPLWRPITVDTGWGRAAGAVLRGRLGARTGAAAGPAAAVVGDQPPASLALAFAASPLAVGMEMPGADARPF